MTHSVGLTFSAIIRFTVFLVEFFGSIMSIVEFFGIYVLLISFISEDKKLYKFCEVNNIETPKNYLLLTHHHPNLFSEI